MPIMRKEQIVEALQKRGYKEVSFRTGKMVGAMQAPDVNVQAFVHNGAPFDKGKRPVMVTQIEGHPTARIFVVLDSLAELDVILNWERDR